MLAKSYRAIVFLLSVCLLAPPGVGCAEDPEEKKPEKKSEPGEAKRGLNLYSPEREMRLGERLSMEVERSMRLLHDPVVVDYVRDVAERIGRNSDIGMPIQVRVVDSSEVGAFTLPGGYFYVNAGLILEAQTEAELAGVVAHEVAHIAARHATRQMSRAQIWNWASIPLFLFGGPIAYAIQNGVVLAVPLTFLKFSRDAEREADRLGLHYHYASGYDPMAVVQFFERTKRMERDKVGGIAAAFATHPMTRERVVAAEDLIDSQMPEREEYVIDTSRHREVQNHLRWLLEEQDKDRDGLVLRKRKDAKDKRPF